MMVMMMIVMMMMVMVVSPFEVGMHILKPKFMHTRLNLETCHQTVAACRADKWLNGYIKDVILTFIRHSACKKCFYVIIEPVAEKSVFVM